MQSSDRSGVILVVEDDDFVRRVVQTFLEKAGYAVISATDGRAGLALFEQTRGSITLLLTDVSMPHMNGLDLADRVLELDWTLPVLFMSGTSAHADRGYGCLRKPFVISELIAKVGAALKHEAA
jgi:DNA-binding response OmpR family regulator